MLAIKQPFTKLAKTSDLSETPEILSSKSHSLSNGFHNAYIHTDEATKSRPNHPLPKTHPLGSLFLHYQDFGSWIPRFKICIPNSAFLLNFFNHPPINMQTEKWILNFHPLARSWRLFCSLWSFPPIFCRARSLRPLRPTSFTSVWLLRPET